MCHSFSVLLFESTLKMPVCCKAVPVLKTCFIIRNERVVVQLPVLKNRVCCRVEQEGLVTLAQI